MADVKRGPIRRYIGHLQTYLHHFGEGLVATDGVVYTAVATFGATATSILDELVDPGFAMDLKELELSTVQKFEELTDAQGSIAYNIRVREEWTGYGTHYLGAWVDVSGTYTKGIGSLASSEDTLEGYLSVASISRAPVRVQVRAVTLAASQFTGKIKRD